VCPLSARRWQQQARTGRNAGTKEVVLNSALKRSEADDLSVSDGDDSRGPALRPFDRVPARGVRADSGIGRLQHYVDPSVAVSDGTLQARPAKISTERILGYSVYAGTVEPCTEEIADWVTRGGNARWLACLNPHSYAVAREKPDFRDALLDADWLIPDGVGVVYASRALGGRIRDRITGFDVFDGVNRVLDSRGGARVFFLGSTEETLRDIREKMALDYPNLQVVGTYSPPFRPEYSTSEIDEMIDAINAAKPDVLWVGMTAPKQETWIRQVRGRIDAKFVAAIGAVFDFYTGRIQRSPPVFQRLGLEWLPRLLQEPRRLWRRMFVSAPIFVRDVARERALRS
jgi:N-acetylglucosaminyldiphosphoundecaprenol N-acetyl-beta-D-mannosaminyltransferase